jgi:outer membrane protein TolC
MRGGLGWVCAALLVATPTTGTAQSMDAMVHGVPAGQVSAEPIALSLRDAIRRGLEQNLGVILEAQRLKGTEGARMAALSELLPHVSGTVRRSDQVLSTAAFGFTLPGLPTLLGPFGLFDARVSMSAPLFDARGFGALRSGRAEVRAGQATVQDVREAVVLAVGTLYLQAEAGAARVDSARAQVATADALVQMASDQRAAGLVAGIDVLQQQVQLQSAQSRLIAAENEFEKSKLSLARAIGLPAGQRFTLANTTTFIPSPPTTIEQAVHEAEANRADLRAAQARVDAARAARSAEAAGRVPTVHLDADVGAIGPSTSTTERTYSVAAVVRVPMFEGGSVRARVQQAESELHSREAELADVAAGLRYEVERALLDMKAADAGVEVADRARELSRQQLEQAQDRFRAGVSTSLELVKAQETVAAVTEQYIASVYAHAIAKASFIRATGQVERQFVALVGGAQP